MSPRFHRLARRLSIALAWLALSGPGALAEATPQAAEITLAVPAVSVSAPAIRTERIIATAPPIQRFGWSRTARRAPALAPSPSQRRFLRHCALLR